MMPKKDLIVSVAHTREVGSFVTSKGMVAVTMGGLSSSIVCNKPLDAECSVCFNLTVEQAAGLHAKLDEQLRCIASKQAIQ